MTIENATEILAQSDQIGCKDLQMATVQFMTKMENIGNMVQNENWHELTLRIDYNSFC